MPELNVSELNIVISVFGAFMILYGFLSAKMKNVWYLGEALPAFLMGIVLGPLAAKFIDATRWGSAAPYQKEEITLGLTRVVIGIQLVIAGYQLPAKYQKMRWREMLILLIPTMTIMWLATTLCILFTVPKLTLLAAMVIGSCVTSTDPILSQAVAKGPFSDKFVPRALREIISSEAGANDGFGFPFLMLATYLMRFSTAPAPVSNVPPVAPVLAATPNFNASAALAGSMVGGAGTLLGRAEVGGSREGGVPMALSLWFVETWLYFVLMSAVYGAVVGYLSCRMLRFALRRKWIDCESYLLWPTAIGLFLLGTCGAIGTDDLLACFVAGSVLNWDGKFLEETEKRHDEVNSCIDVLLNFAGFMYIGTVIPWEKFNQPELTGITYGRLFGLGILVLLFRRIPAILITYKAMPNVCKSWKEALFMGYFGPIGIGAVFYVEHAKHLFPKPGAGDQEENELLTAIDPVVYWLALFSIIVHGLSIPLLDLIYAWMGVQPIQEDAQEIEPRSVNFALPNNSVYNPKRRSVIVYNRFSRGANNSVGLPFQNRLSGASENSQEEKYYPEKSDMF